MLAGDRGLARARVPNAGGDVIDTERFDRLIRSLATPGTRRGLLHRFGAGLLAGTLAPLLGAGSAVTAKKKRRQSDDDHGSSHRRHRRKAKHRHDPGQDQKRHQGKRQRKGKDKGKDKGTDAGTTACTKRSCTPGSCGSVSDGCGGTMPCGCPANQICVAGACQQCTVTCPSGDPVACGLELNAQMNAGGTVYVCPGTYRGGFDLPGSLASGVTVIGAGEGANPASNTVLNAFGSIESGGAGRVLNINAGVGTVTLEQLHLTGGSAANGGGIFHRGSTLRMTACTVTGNTSTGEGTVGGGLAIGRDSRTLEMTRCTVSHNSTAHSRAIGGGIACFGRMTLTDCVIETNTAGSFGGGLFLRTNSDVLSQLLGSTTVRGNTVALGGGIFIDNGRLEIAETCRVTRNTATATVEADPGGGIFNNHGTVTLLGPADPSPIVVDNCAENCGGAVPRCAPGGPVGRICP